MPRRVFSMPTVSVVTSTAGFVLAYRMGFFDWPAPHVSWVWTAPGIVAVMKVQGFGFLLPINLLVYCGMRTPQPDGQRIQRWMRFSIRMVASQAVLQFAIIYIMAKFATGSWG
jgi:hypothetical protein